MLTYNCLRFGKEISIISERDTIRRFYMFCKAGSDDTLYLKRLEMLGFKSFAVRTVLEFSTGITAVAGPNGAGKWNVADAVRWVLGEQKMRQLRAKRREESIFGGRTRKACHGTDGGLSPGR